MIIIVISDTHAVFVGQLAMIGDDCPSKLVLFTSLHLLALCVALAIDLLTCSG